MIFDSDVIIVDTETTGLLKPIPTKIEKQPFATEIYANWVRKEKLERWI